MRKRQRGISKAVEVQEENRTGILITAMYENSCKTALGCSAVAINFIDFELLVSFLATITVDNFPLFHNVEIES